MDRERSKAVLPWLLPLAVVVFVLAVALAPGVIIGIVGVVVCFVLGYVAFPLYWRTHQHRGDAGVTSP